MECYRVIITPLTAFATPLKGDTLFGQFCWAVRNRFGESRLQECLEGYTQQKPFTVISDVFPESFFPLPKLPGKFFKPLANGDRKAIKKKNWLPEAKINQPLENWLQLAKSDVEISDKYHLLIEKNSQPHNTINRNTNTTGTLGFAPYNVEQEWYIPSTTWQFFILIDNNKINSDDCKQCLQDIGQLGYGKDASIGLGKFVINTFTIEKLPQQEAANSYLTLAPCAPQGLGFDGNNSYYQLFTRFGKHGDIAVHVGKPFKNPVLLAQTGAVLSHPDPVSGFIGQGIGGIGQLSKTDAATVQQGYAPSIAIRLE